MEYALASPRTLPALPNGISSDARRMPDLDGNPFVVESSRGAWLTTADGKSYIDYTMAMGVTVLGHAPHPVMTALKAAIDKGPMSGFTHAAEEQAAAALTAHTGHLCHASFVNTGSEAVHLACRIARTLSGKPLVAKVAAGYDGWYDDLAVGLCGSPEAAWKGERPVFSGGLTLLRYNDLDDAEALFRERKDVGAILFEPVLANAGCIEAQAGYLKGLVEIARRHDAVVIADEVLAGLRLHPGLSCQKLGIEPDLATVGKAIGSGFPVAAVLGTGDAFRPVFERKVTRSGTYNGNPAAAAAVIATMAEVETADYGALLASGRRLRDGIVAAFARSGIAVSTSGFDSVFTVWFAPKAPTSYDEALPLADPDRALRLHLALRRQGVTTMSFPWGRLFVSFAHTGEVIDQTLVAYAKVAEEMAR